MMLLIVDQIINIKQSLANLEKYEIILGFPHCDEEEQFCQLTIKIIQKLLSLVAETGVKT